MRENHSLIGPRVNEQEIESRHLKKIEDGEGKVSDAMQTNSHTHTHPHDG